MLCTYIRTSARTASHSSTPSAHFLRTTTRRTPQRFCAAVLRNAHWNVQDEALGGPGPRRLCTELQRRLRVFYAHGQRCSLVLRRCALHISTGSESDARSFRKHVAGEADAGQVVGASNEVSGDDARGTTFGRCVDSERVSGYRRE
ncbi:hypothetical protein HYPSUDRAFT_586956 [Hypholoma sublateritium FD-334 SS-4]|uniref:Uncharacterized protein n=1 Tax=Hypholoma sublateritium (strain FD-334 SS-4) TaxID=945553 RepID=A0A0D2PV69_HYPSF|nr:hypothetical protein HYPSUDRAFT_586956 [Hypholoma sublateritium FD-334 SS-4]